MPQTAQANSGAPLAHEFLPSRSRWAVAGEKFLELIIRLAGISAIIFVLAIFFFVFKEAFPVFGSEEFSLTEFLFSTKWYPTSETNIRYGIFALIVGTLSVSGLAVHIAVPFSLGSAIFISEFCGPKLKEFLKIVIEMLAAIPSVVWGFIGLMVTSRLIVQYTSAPVGVNVLNGGIILSLMCVPIITSIAEDALKAVPDTYREAAAALGATRWQIIYRVLLPAAKTGLLAAVLLGVGRAVGETMAVLMATGHAVQIPGGIFDSVRTLTANIAAELGESPAGSDHYRVLFMTGVLLFFITFIVNLTADFVVKGLRKQKWHHERPQHPHSDYGCQPAFYRYATFPEEAEDGEDGQMDLQGHGGHHDPSPADAGHLRGHSCHAILELGFPSGSAAQGNDPGRCLAGPGRHGLPGGGIALYLRTPGSIGRNLSQ
jgi:phosphate transport system permease protein